MTEETPPIGRPAPRAVRRSRDDRVIAGVAGGIARYFGIDPVLVRIGFVVLAISGGAGILAYVIAWAVIPEEHRGEETAAAPGAKGDEIVRIVVGAGLIVVGALALFTQLVGSDFWRVAWPTVLIAVGIAVIARGWRR